MASSAHVLGELPALLDRFRVYAVDVLGQSPLSADVRVPVKGDAHGRWLRDVLDALGLQRTRLVGVSWGGFVSLRLAALAPERLERLALLVPAGLVNGPAWPGLSKVAWPMLRYRLRPSEAHLRALVEHLLTTKGDDWTPYLGDAMRAFRLQLQVPPLARKGELDRLTAPVLVVAADRDLSFPGAQLLARAREVLPSLADTELLNGCYHSPPTTDAFRAWLGARLTRFLEGAPAPAAGGAPPAGG